LSYYSSAVFFIPFGGAVLVAAALLRDRRVYLGLALTAATVFPLLVLDGKLSSAYLYVPLIGVAIAIAAVSERLPARALFLLVFLWLPVNYALVRSQGREILAVDDERRAYIAALQTYSRTVPRLKAVVYGEIPAHMYPWGVEDGIRKVFGSDVLVASKASPAAGQALTRYPMAVISYDGKSRAIHGELRAN